MNIQMLGAVTTMIPSLGSQSTGQDLPGSFAYSLIANNSSGSAALSSSTSSSTVADSSQTLGESIDKATKEFLDYMKETPEQRMLDAWLKAHKMTKEQFDALSPAEKQKIMDEIKRELKEAIKQAAEKKMNSPIDISV